MREISICKLYHNDIKNFVPKKEIENHFKFVIYAVNKICRSYNCFKFREDLIQAGNLGLIESVKKYDPEKGSFLNYAQHWIRSYILKEIHKLKNSASIGIQRFSVYKDPPINYYALDGNSDAFELQDSYDIELSYFKKQILIEFRRALFKVLSQREINLISGRYFKGKSLSEVGKDYNVSKQRIHQLEVIAFNKLRNSQEVQRIYKMYQDFLAA